MLRELFFNFILGGILFSLIYYVANVIEDPSLSAVIALLPIAIISGFIINKVDNCKKFYKNALSVIVITFLLMLLLVKLLDIKIFSKNIIIAVVLIFWVIIQYCRHKYLKR